MNQALPRAIVIDEVSTPPLPPKDDDIGFGFQDLLSILYSQRLFMLLILVVTVGVGFAVVIAQPKVYYADAQIALGATVGGAIDNGALGGGAAQGPDNALVQSELEVLRSNDLMMRLVKTLGPQTISEKLGLPNPGALANITADSDKMRDLVKVLQGRLKVGRAQTSNVLNVGFSTPSPEASVLFANALIDSYLEGKVDERTAAAQRAAAWLNRRVDQLAEEVKAKEAAVATYRAEMNLISIDGASLNGQEYFKLQGEVVAARADLASKEARLAKVEQISTSGGSGETVQDAVASPTIQALRQREAEIAGREAELKQRYGENHPSVQRVLQEHEEVEQQITAEITRIKSSLANEVDVAHSRVRELQAGLNELETSLFQGNRALVRLKELERDAEASSVVYRDFMTRAHEIAEQESLKVVDARVVSRAIRPTKPSSTSPMMWLAFLTAMGLVAALVGGMARATLNDRIVRPETVARRVGAPALVSVPLINQRQLRKLPPDERTPEDFLVNKPMTAFAESLRVLGANLVSMYEGEAGLAVAVTSALAAEGKTTIALSLGRAAAMSGLKVLIIDCDARRPSLSAGIGETPELTVADVISQKVSWKEAAVVDPLTSALVLPINTERAQMQSLFRPEAVRKLLNEVRGEFDLIVLDCPPVLAVAETRWITLVADATIVVARWNRTRSGAVRTAAREVLKAKGRVAGIVLNRIDVGMTKRFSFSDPLYYGAAGKGYYTN